MHRVTEFAAQKGVTRARVYQLIRAGALPAHQLPDGTLVLDDAAMDWYPRQTRPLSYAMAWNLLSMLDGRRPAGLRNAERARVHRHIAAIAAAPSPALELAIKVSARAQLEAYLAPPAAIIALRNDPRVRISGVSAPGSPAPAGALIEGYVHTRELDALRNAFALERRRRGNVRLHVDPADQPRTTARIGRAAIAADLADWRQPAHLTEANRILDALLHDGLGIPRIDATSA